MKLTLDDGTEIPFTDLSEVYDKVPRQMVVIEMPIEDLPKPYRTLVEAREAYWKPERRKLLSALLEGKTIEGVRLVSIPPGEKE